MVRATIQLAYTALTALLILAGRLTFKELGRMSSMSVEARFSESEVVPDVIPVAPSQAAEVVYTVDGSELRADFGNVLTPTQVQNPPRVTWPAEDGALYTLLMTDPDAPSRQNPKFREWRHWLVMNIPGNDVSKGEECVVYVGAGPPKGTGLHRYVQLVFKQPGRVSCPEPKLGLTANGRASHKTVDLMSQYNLGKPVAGNFFQAEWDDYVPKLYEKLSG